MTLQQPVERRPKKIDINLLPSEFRPAKKSRLNLILYITIFVLACVIAVLIIMKSGVNSDSNSLQTELNSLQQQLGTLQANKAEADVIKSQITIAQNQLAVIIADDQTFQNDNILWSQVITELDDLIPQSKINVTTIGVNSDHDIAFSGTAARKTYVYDLVVDLQESDYFYDIEFSFGDCPDIAQCSFSITASVSNTSQMEGGVNE